VTDRQTDGQTDIILIARLRLHYMQRGKNRTIDMKLPYLVSSPLTPMRRM